MIRALALAVALVSVAAIGGGATPAPRPLRIVSINPCVDAVLMRIADPGSIVAISRYSQDPRATSVPLAWARRFRVTSGTAEEVVALQPDLVLAGGHVDPSTLIALRRMNVRVATFAVPVSIEESVAQVRDLARDVGQPARGEALARQIEGAAAPLPGPAVPALIWQGEGLVPGKGTLADALLTRAGFQNQSARYGLKQWDVLPLEYLLARPPRILFSASGDMARDRLSRHPAVARLATRIRIAPYPMRLLTCGGPAIIEAMARLKAARRSLGA